jgi:uncharacterized protein with FMN-binding domain
MMGDEHRRTAPVPAEAAAPTTPERVERPAVPGEADGRTAARAEASPSSGPSKPGRVRMATPTVPRRASTKTPATTPPDVTSTPAPPVETTPLRPVETPTAAPVTVVTAIPPVSGAGASTGDLAPATASKPPNARKDGTYSGWGTSRHGDIQASVVIQDGRIISASITQCLTRYSCSWIELLPPQVVSRQSPEIDYVSGATQSTNAFYYAIVEALSKAK